MTAQVRDRDHGYKALMKRLKASQPTRGTVGIHEAEGAAEEEGGATVLDIANFMEFGTEHIPPRSFIGDYADENLDKNRGRMRLLAKAVISGKVPDFDQGMDRFGLLIVSEIQARIRDGIAPDLQQATIDAKGSSTPLIGKSGQLWTSIRHQILKGTE